MRRIFKIGSIGLAIAGAIIGGGEAFAIPALFDQEATGGTRLGISGTPNSTKTVTFSGATFTRTATIRVNACGFAIIPNPSQYTEGNILISAPIGNNSFNVANVKASTAISEPTCNNGVAVGLPSTGLAYNIGRGAILLRGLPESRVLDISYQSSDPITRTVTLNACGYGVTPKSGNNVSIDGAAPVPTLGLPYARYSCANGVLYGAVFTGNGNYAPITPLPNISRLANNRLVFTAAPSTPLTISFNGATISRSVTSDRCKGLYLPATTTGTVKINGVSINVDTLPTRTGQETCTFNSEFNMYFNSQGYGSARYADGRVYIQNYAGLTLGDRSIVTVESTGSRNVSPVTNSCGYSIVSGTASAPITESSTFNYGGTSYTVGSLPLIAGSPRCSNGTLTVPTN